MNPLKHHWSLGYRNLYAQSRRAGPSKKAVAADESGASRKRRIRGAARLVVRGGLGLALALELPSAKKAHLRATLSVPDLGLLDSQLAPYGLCRARVHESWSEFPELPLPSVAETPPDWQARVGWAGRFEKVAARVVSDPAKPHHLGRGKSGKVIRMRERATGRDLAVKKFKNRDGYAGDAARSVRNEFEVAHKLRHPRVVAPLAMAVDDERGKAFLVYPLVDGTPLAKCQDLSEATAKQVLRDIAGALAYLFAENVTHNDVHGNNIMVHNGRGYLIDFGLASKHADVLSKRDLMFFCGTMSHFWPYLHGSEAYKFFTWFKSRIKSVDERVLLREVLAHPYVAKAGAVAGATLEPDTGEIGPPSKRN